LLIWSWQSVNLGRPGSATRPVNRATQQMKSDLRQRKDVAREQTILGASDG